MANVLRKTTPHEYLLSVNTPDYPEIDWIINPDLSNVLGVPNYYWVIETVPAVEEVRDVDGNITTEYAAEINTVREMTIAEKTAYDGTVIPVVPTNVLSSGVPAFLDKARNIVRSINEMEFTFSAKTTGAKNFYLNSGGLISSNIHGYVLIDHSLILSIICKIQKAVSSDITFDIINNATSEVVTSGIIPSGQTIRSIVDLSIKLQEMTELSCYVTSVDELANPMVRLSFSTVNQG